MSDLNETRRLISSRLAIARQQAGLSQAQVARILDIPRPSISEIEANRRRVAADELVRFAELYCVDIEWLTGKDTEGVDPLRDKLQLAARNIASLKDDDIEKVIGLLESLKRGS